MRNDGHPFSFARLLVISVAAPLCLSGCVLLRSLFPAGGPCDEAQFEATFASADTGTLVERCANCHTNNGVAGGTRYILQKGDDDATRSANLAALWQMAQVDVDGEPLLLSKPTASVSHGGGAQIRPADPLLGAWQRVVAEARACSNSTPLIQLAAAAEDQRLAAEAAMCAPGDSACAVAGRGTPVRIRRLTLKEIDNSASTLLGERVTPTAGFPADATPDGYDNNSSGLAVQQRFVSGMNTSATHLAKKTVAQLATLAPCSSASADAACARTFLSDFARNAYRRTLSTEEVDQLMSLFTLGSTGGTFSEGVSVALEAVFQSGSFLYRTELGDGPVGPNGEVHLTQNEIASELSYLVTGGPPDAALLAAADAGGLGTPEARVAHAQRLAETPAAKSQFADFVQQWLGVNRLPTKTKDAALFPEYTPALVASMLAETSAFVQDAVFTQNGGLLALFVSPSSFADSALSLLYGADTSKRPGLLTQASFLATYAQPTHGSPVFRGKFVRTNLYCLPVPPPPPDVSTTLSAATTIHTNRDRYAAHGNATCQACHALMDPIGFTFENYDAIGRYRTMDNGYPVDATGALPATPDDTALADALQLSATVGASATVRQCFASNWFRFAMGRSTFKGDDGTLLAVFRDFQGGQQRVRDLIDDVVLADEFSIRIVP